MLLTVRNLSSESHSFLEFTQLFPVNNSGGIPDKGRWNDVVYHECHGAHSFRETGQSSWQSTELSERRHQEVLLNSHSPEILWLPHQLNLKILPNIQVLSVTIELILGKITLGKIRWICCCCVGYFNTLENQIPISFCKTISQKRQWLTVAETMMY